MIPPKRLVNWPLKSAWPLVATSQQGSCKSCPPSCSPWVNITSIWSLCLCQAHCWHWSPVQHNTLDCPGSVVTHTSLSPINPTFAITSSPYYTTILHTSASPSHLPSPVYLTLPYCTQVFVNKLDTLVVANHYHHSLQILASCWQHLSQMSSPCLWQGGGLPFGTMTHVGWKGLVGIKLHITLYL